MKLSTVSASDVAGFLRLESGGYTESELEMIMAAAKSYLEAHTGIPAEGEGETLDDHEDITLAFMVLCQDMYDNRALYIEPTGANRVVESIIAQHARNLL